MYAGSKAVPLYDKAVSSISELLFILEQLNTYSICPAIDDPKFKPLIKKHGGLLYDCHGKKVASYIPVKYTDYIVIDHCIQSVN